MTIGPIYQGWTMARRFTRNAKSQPRKARTRCGKSAPEHGQLAVKSTANMDIADMTNPTQEAASLAQMIREWMTGPDPLSGDGLERVIEKRLARLRPAGDSGEVAVKALEWEPYPNPVFAGPDVAIAHVEFRCFYQVQRDPHAPGFMAYLTPQYGTLFWESKGHNDIEAAKAAAQADYDRRIRSALAAPVRSPDAGVKEAGRKLAKAVWGIDFVEPPQPPEQEAVRVTDEAVRAVKEIKTLVVAAFNNPRLAKSTLNSVAHKLEALATALASAKPEGWRLVPVEPTDAMLKAAASVNFENEDERGMACNLWHVMLAAAPAEEVKL